MTANRVITDHGELDGIGSLTHPQIDAYIDTTEWVVLSGSLVPPNARTLVAGSNVTITDGGPGGDLTISSTGGGGGGDLISWMETPSGTVDGSNASFSVAHVPSPSTSLMLFVDGILLSQGSGSDYTLSGTAITLRLPPVPGAQLHATYPYSAPSSTSWAEVPSGTVDGVNMVFTLAHPPSPSTGLMLFVNGILLSQGSGSDYTLSGATIVLLDAPPVGSNVLATYPF